VDQQLRLRRPPRHRDRRSFLLVANDGSLTRFLQREEPERADMRANCLPTPQGDFRPILRMYEPDKSIFEGTYELPPIRRRH
jgi:hypothetical protein